MSAGELEYDVIVVGAGNAAACAAISAQNNGARVLMLEAAPEAERGGNSTYTAGAMRYAFDGVEDVLTLVPDVEGADFRNYTYAKYGSAILAQPGQFAWQVFDGKVISMLRDEYRIRQITKVTSDTLEGLADQMEGVDRDGFLRTNAAFNGVKIGANGQVHDAADLPISGLFAAGEMVGGLFFHDDPGGTGLTSGAVFGKIAGEGAAAAAATNKSRSAA